MCHTELFQYPISVRAYFPQSDSAPILIHTRDIAAVATQLAYAKNFDTADQTFDLWPWFLIAEIVQTLAVFTSCIPYLRPFLEALNSGLFMSDELRRRGGSVTYLENFPQDNHKRKIFKKATKKPKPNTLVSLQSIADRTKTTQVESRNLVCSSAQVRTDIGTTGESDEIIADMWDAASQGSETRIIKATTVVKTQIENTKGLGGGDREESCERRLDRAA